VKEPAEEARENRNNRDHHQQFDQRKADAEFTS
jgi:hypothetical protein